MPDIDITNDSPPTTHFTRRLNRKFYELTDHLGNVRAVLGDRKRTSTPGAGNYFGEIRSYQHVYPFGMPQPGRTWDSSANYRYGFNGMETDAEVKRGAGKHYTTFFRQYDPRLGRWWSNDPVVQMGESPYVAVKGNPISNADPRGDNVTAQNSNPINPIESVGEFGGVTLEEVETNLEINDLHRFIREWEKGIFSEHYIAEAFERKKSQGASYDLRRVVFGEGNDNSRNNARGVVAEGVAAHNLVTSFESQLKDKDIRSLDPYGKSKKQGLDVAKLATPPRRVIAIMENMGADISIHVTLDKMAPVEIRGGRIGLPVGYPQQSLNVTHTRRDGTLTVTTYKGQDRENGQFTFVVKVKGGAKRGLEQFVQAVSQLEKVVANSEDAIPIVYMDADVFRKSVLVITEKNAKARYMEAFNRLERMNGLLILQESFGLVEQSESHLSSLINYIRVRLGMQTPETSEDH